MLKLVKSERDKFLIDIHKLHDNLIYFFFTLTIKVYGLLKRHVIVH